MNRNLKINTSAQGGFTLIELIVVIVILGILAATALPKFANLGGDARVASLNAAKGAMSSAAAIVHGKYLVNPSSLSATKVITLEGTAITATANGYPTADAAGILAAAGISTNDYKLYTSTSTDAIKPAITDANTIALVPASLAGQANAANCYVTYKMASTDASPTVALPTTVPTASTCE